MSLRIYTQLVDPFTQALLFLLCFSRFRSFSFSFVRSLSFSFSFVLVHSRSLLFSFVLVRPRSRSQAVSFFISFLFFLFFFFMFSSCSTLFFNETSDFSDLLHFLNQFCASEGVRDWLLFSNWKLCPQVKFDRKYSNSFRLCAFQFGVT